MRRQILVPLPDDPDPGTATGAPPEGAEQRYTQADLDRLAGTVRAEARTRTLQDIQAKLGMTPEDAVAVLERARAADDAAKTEAQREKDAAAKAKADADAARAAADRERHEARVERALIRAGVDPTADKLLTRAVALVDAPVGAEPDVIDAAVKALAADLPALFTAKEQPPNSDPGKQPPKKPNGGNAVERGRAEARELWGKKQPAA